MASVAPTVSRRAPVALDVLRAACVGQASGSAIVARPSSAHFRQTRTSRGSRIWAPRTSFCPLRSEPHRNFSTSAPPAFPPHLIATAPLRPGVTRLTDRSLISITGRDTIKLLQGLVTNDMRKLERGELMGMYAALLGPQGRAIAPVLISFAPGSSNVPEEMTLLIDVDSRSLPSLLAFIKRFKLRSKVTLTGVGSDYDVYAAWGIEDAATEEGVWMEKTIFKDTRSPQLGWRAIVKKGEPNPFESLAQAHDPSAYTQHRILQGIADGPEDWPENHALPQEANLDYMHGVDFRKGCYVGQELTARTHHKGVVRKRVIPVSLYPLSSPEEPLKGAPGSLTAEGAPVSLPKSGTDVRSVPLPTTGADGSPTTPRRGRSAGRFLSGAGNVGLALLRLEQVGRWGGKEPTAGAGLFMTVEAEDGSTLGVRPWIPSWWPEDPRREIISTGAAEE